MVNAINKLKLKKILEQYYNENIVYIKIIGIIETSFRIEKAKIFVNRNKLLIMNDEQNFELEFDYLIDIQIDDKIHIELIYKNISVILET